MALIDCGGLAVISGHVTLPLYGAWTAELVLDGEELAEGLRVTLEADGGLALVGNVRRSGSFRGAVRVQVVGGAGGLDRQVGARYYQQALLRDPLLDVLAEAGETMSATIASTLLSSYLERWTTTAARAGVALSALADHAGVRWRVLSDGTIWLGEDTWETQTAENLDVLWQAPERGFVLLGVATPALLPGVELEGIGRLSLVEHTISPGRVRTRAWLHDV